MMGLPLYCDFIDTFVDTLGLSKLVLIGNSLGSVMSWDFTVWHPGHVEELVLIDSVSFSIKLPTCIDLFNRTDVRITSPWMLPEGVIRAATCDVYGDPSRASEPTLCRYADFSYVDGARQAIDKMVPRSCFDDVDTGGLVSIRVPMLTLWDQRDRWIPSMHVGEPIHCVPGATLRMYPALDHIPMEEDPVRVETDLYVFLDQGHASTCLSKTIFQENHP